VAKVAPESLAHKIGFRAGDRLAAYRGEKVGSKERFAYLRERPSVGDAAITVLRGKERLSLVVPAGRPLELELLNVTAHPRSDER
jgi:S1-C subfamily serine protease